MTKTLVVLLLMLVPRLGEAGAWQREKGQVFLSLSQEAYSDGAAQERYSKLYAEYGFTPRFTVGGELSESAQWGDRVGLLFLRTPLWDLGEHHHLSIEFGAGYHEQPSLSEPFIRNSLSWGRGFDSRWGHGWVNIDVISEQWLHSLQQAYKADLTLGLDLQPKTKLILQVQSGDYPSVEPYMRFVPSLTYEFRPGAHLELGVRKGVKNDKSQGLKVGTWLQF